MIARLVRFGLLGALSFALNLGLTALFHEVLGLAEEAAFAGALILVFAVNFASCRYVVFAGPQAEVGPQLVLYTLSALFFRGAEYLSFLLLHTWLGVPYLVAVAAVLILWFLIKFTYYGRVVFAGKS